jgi:hypothetical protein
MASREIDDQVEDTINNYLNEEDHDEQLQQPQQPQPPQQSPAQQPQQPSRQPTPQELEDLKFIAMCYGVPVTRRVLKQIVNNTEIRQQDKLQLYKKIDQIHPEFVNPGAINFVDQAGKTWYIILDDCSRDHDLDKELAKITAGPNAWIDIKRKMSIMFNYARHMYANLINENSELADQLRNALGWSIDIDQLQYDLETTQLYICKEWIDRIGFHVKPPPPNHHMN